MSQFIAITADDQPIWGIGDTESAAIAEAREYGATNINAENRDQFNADLKAIACTDTLYALVALQGGDCGWSYLADGTAATHDEVDAVDFD